MLAAHIALPNANSPKHPRVEDLFEHLHCRIETFVGGDQEDRHPRRTHEGGDQRGERHATHAAAAASWNTTTVAL